MVTQRMLAIDVMVMKDLACSRVFEIATLGEMPPPKEASPVQACSTRLSASTSVFGRRSGRAGYCGGRSERM